MTSKVVLAFYIFAIFGLAIVSVVDADCRWLDCHAHSAGDWCNILGPGYKVKNWRRCNGIWGKQEYCCN